MRDAQSSVGFLINVVTRWLRLKHLLIAEFRCDARDAEATINVERMKRRKTIICENAASPHFLQEQRRASRHRIGFENKCGDFCFRRHATSLIKKLLKTKSTRDAVCAGDQNRESVPGEECKRKNAKVGEHQQALGNFAME